MPIRTTRTFLQGNAPKAAVGSDFGEGRGPHQVTLAAVARVAGADLHNKRSPF
jgi:hypothetical protein